MNFKALWFGAIKQQAYTWAYVDSDLCHHVTVLGYNEFVTN